MGSQTSAAAAKMSLNRIQVYGPEMRISFPVVGSMQEPFWLQLVFLKPRVPPRLFFWLWFCSLDSLMSTLSLLLNFRHTEDKWEISSSVVYHSPAGRVGPRKWLLNIFCMWFCKHNNATKSIVRRGNSMERGHSDKSLWSFLSLKWFYLIIKAKVLN